MQLEPYLFFYGRCEEALNFYKGIFGGEITSMMRFSEAPPDMQSEASAEDKKKIMHSNFVAGDLKFMAADGRGEAAKDSNVSLSLASKDRAEGKRVFDKLSEGGKVDHPFSDAFWGGQFGMVKDRFGIDWMVVAE